MEWGYEDLTNWIKKGCDKEEGLKVKKLVCYGKNVMPSEIGALRNLRYLKWIGDREWLEGLLILPSEIGFLKKLQYLNCSNNYLTNLPPEIGFLRQLQHLNCSNNCIKDIPPEIKNCRKLQYFRCSYNGICSLPSEIGNLQHLQQLICDNNNFMDLPKEIELLQKIRYFNCCNNFLKYLPPIGNPKILLKLWCNNNEIENLPKNMTEIKWLLFLPNKCTALTREEHRFLLSMHNGIWMEEELAEKYFKTLNYNRRKNAIIFAKSIENENTNIGVVFRNLLRVICEFI